MHTKLGKFSVGAVAAAALFMSAGLAHGAATIINPAGSVALGVKDTGALNTDVGNVALNGSGRTGLAYNFGAATAPEWLDATAPGCWCEGWGVSATYKSTGYSGYDGTDNGFANLSTGAFASTATTATANAFLTNLAGLKVQHAYSPADNAPGALFKSVVTITNDTDDAITDVRYVRVMDWDVPRTEFNEFVTIKGTATTTLLEKSHNNGFNTPDPLNDFGQISAGSCGSTTDVDFTDCGTADHGAYFRFNFGSLGVGESYSFTIFYGAAANESDAIAAIAAESIELYSLGQSNVSGLPNNDGPTFIFGFAGVGGEPIEGVPEPMSLSLVGLGLAAMGALRRRRRAA